MTRNSRDDVIAAAGRLFAERGYHGTSMRELGKELVIRTLPQIEFQYDESIEGAISIISKIDELAKEFTPEEEELILNSIGVEALAEEFF